MTDIHLGVARLNAGITKQNNTGRILPSLFIYNVKRETEVIVLTS